MNVDERLVVAKRAIQFIATKYDETDDVIHNALAELVKEAGDASTNLAANRKAAEAAHAAYLKRVEDNKAAVLATNGVLPPPMNASIGLKV